MSVASWTNMKVQSPTDRAHLKRSAVLRSAAVLTDTYVASNEIIVDECSRVGVFFSITKTSLTSFQYKVEQSFDDGVSWYSLGAESVTLTTITDGIPEYSRTLAGNENWFKIFNIIGNRFRVQVKGTGTVTASSCLVTAVGVY